MNHVNQYKSIIRQSCPKQFAYTRRNQLLLNSSTLTKQLRHKLPKTPPRFHMASGKFLTNTLAISMISWKQWPKMADSSEAHRGPTTLKDSQSTHLIPSGNQTRQWKIHRLVADFPIDTPNFQWISQLATFKSQSSYHWASTYCPSGESARGKLQVLRVSATPD